jgi:hypothetical protein
MKTSLSCGCSMHVSELSRDPVTRDDAANGASAGGERASCWGSWKTMANVW